MPSRKQRRRRDKLQRHEYEYVVETEEGEVPLRELKDEGRQPKDGKESAAAPLDRRGRAIPKPSLNRVLKRAAIFAPILVIFVYLTAGEDLEPVGVVLNAAILLAFFIPFSYLVDVILYRIMSRRAKGR